MHTAIPTKGRKRGKESMCVWYGNPINTYFKWKGVSTSITIMQGKRRVRDGVIRSIFREVI